MHSITISIPGDVIDALKVPSARAEEELRHEFAVYLVREGLLSASKARRVAQMERLAFEDLLARRRVSWDGDADEVADQVAAALKALGPKSDG